MKKLFVALAVSASLALGGCVTDGIGNLGSFLTTSYTNPVGKKELAEVELSYQAAAKVYVACKKLHCTSTANLKKYQVYDQVAYSAIVAARPVVRNNPTVSGLQAVVVAKQAVLDFQTALGR